MSSRDDVGIPACTLLIGSIALILSMVGNFYCGYSSREAIFSSGTNAPLRFKDYRAGIWGYQDFDIFLVASNGSIRANGYSYCVPYNKDIQTDIVRDTPWTSARVFTIMSAVIGGLTVVAGCFAMCADSKTNSVLVKVLALSYFLCTLFQGLTFLFFSSVACDSGTGSITKGGVTYDVTIGDCKPTYGANCSIASVVFYFVAMLLACAGSVTSKSRPAEPKDNAGEQEPLEAEE
mmetsp:Transcript_19790/g.24413  ORF Transcript_19790/g.24413 Transcript_19790/m.24413 type:complete len:234 (+) Transcript_19790:112-813(+)